MANVTFKGNPMTLVGTEVKEGSSVKLTVSSGEALQKTVSVYVDLPQDVTKEVSLKLRTEP